MTTRPGGYCPMCDIEYTGGHKCTGKESYTTWKDNEGFPVPTFHCNKCGQNTEGFSICLKCNPQSYTIDPISVGKQTCTCAKDTCEYPNEDTENFQSPNCKFNTIEKIEPLPYKEYSVFEREIWNAAIEAAALECIKVRLVGVHFVAEQIRKLKK